MLGVRCKGGYHRSIAIAEVTAAALEDEGWYVEIDHRKLGDAGGCGCPTNCRNIRNCEPDFREYLESGWEADSTAAKHMASRIWAGV